VRAVLVKELKRGTVTDKFVSNYKFANPEMATADAVAALAAGGGSGAGASAPAPAALATSSLAALDNDGSGRLEYLRVCALLAVRPNPLVLQQLAGPRLELLDYALTRRVRSLGGTGGTGFVGAGSCGEGRSRCSEELYPEAQALISALAVNTLSKDIEIAAPLSCEGGRLVIEAVARSNSARHLTLRLKAASLSAAACLSGFLTLPDCSLRKLDLSATQVGDQGMLTMCRGLEGNRSLTALHLRQCQVQAIPGLDAASARIPDASASVAAHVSDGGWCGLLAQIASAGAGALAAMLGEARLQVDAPSAPVCE
jgi:hypothetical protein